MQQTDLTSETSNQVYEESGGFNLSMVIGCSKKEGIDSVLFFVVCFSQSLKEFVEWSGDDMDQRQNKPARNSRN